MKIIFLFAFISCLVVYPVYFYYLMKFGDRIKLEHPEEWSKISKKYHYSIFHTSYIAINKTKYHQILGKNLSDESIEARCKAVRFLYIGAALFLVVVVTALFESLKG